MRHDVIVVGLGGMGSAVLYELARRGVAALGLDRFGAPSDRGSTTGPTRTFREAYFDHEIHVRMARRARERWLELEHESGAQLFEATGALLAAPRGHPVLEGVIRSAIAHDLPHEQLDAGEIARRWRALRPAEDDAGVLEHRAGLLRVPATMRAHVHGALRRGACVRSCEPVVSVKLLPDGVEIGTLRARYHAAAAVLSLGPWLVRGPGGARVLGYSPPLEVCRQPQLFFDAPDAAFAAGALCPFNYALPGDAPSCYGTPDAGHGVMVARHYGGEPTAPDAVDRALRARDAEDVRAFLRARMPALDLAPRAAAVGLYTNTPDRRFLLGLHPETDRIVVAGGFSGHGYKFAPVIGEIAADLVTARRTGWDLSLFAPDRFAGAT